MDGMTDEKETLDPSKMPPPNNAPHFTGDQTEQDKRLE